MNKIPQRTADRWNDSDGHEPSPRPRTLPVDPRDQGRPPRPRRIPILAGRPRHSAAVRGCAATGVWWRVWEDRRSRQRASCSATPAKNGVRAWKFNSSATATSESRSPCRRDRRSTSRRICRGTLHEVPTLLMGNSPDAGTPGALVSTVAVLPERLAVNRAVMMPDVAGSGLHLPWSEPADSPLLLPERTAF